MKEELLRAAELYRSGLPEGEFAEFPIEDADPVGTGVHLMRSGLSRDGGPFLCGMGYGSTALEATVSARGELFEMVVLRDASASWPVRQATYRDLKRAGENAVDPMTLVLPVGSGNVDDREFLWTTMERLPDREEWLVPLEFAVSSRGSLPPDYTPITPPITNGNGAGDTADRAIVHGLLELLQRDGNAASFRALDQGRVLVDPPLDHATETLLRNLRGKGLNVTFKLADLSCGIPSVYAIPVLQGLDNPLAMTACGEAADPDLSTACRKAALEALAARARKIFSHSASRRVLDLEPEEVSERARAIDLDAEEPDALKAMLELMSLPADEVKRRLDDTVLSRRTEVRADDIPRGTLSDAPSKRLENVVQRLHREGLEVFVKTARRGDAFAAKVVVPKIEMELGSFERLGLRGTYRLLERNDPLILREDRQGAKRVALRTEDEEALGGPAFLDTSRLQRLSSPLYFLYREPTPGAVRVHLEKEQAA